MTTVSGVFLVSHTSCDVFKTSYVGLYKLLMIMLMLDKYLLILQEPYSIYNRFSNSQSHKCL